MPDCVLSRLAFVQCGEIGFTGNLSQAEELNMKPQMMLMMMMIGDSDDQRCKKVVQVRRQDCKCLIWLARLATTILRGFQLIFLSLGFDSKKKWPQKCHSFPFGLLSFGFFSIFL